jgi:polysaccharide pyruvyl transferase WcaK-like protein
VRETVRRNPSRQPPTGFRRLRSYLRSGVACLPLLWPSRRRAAYIGWIGHGNMGDEGMYAVFRDLLPACRFVKVSPGRALRAVHALAPFPLFGAAVLGGGTLIGSPGSGRVLTEILSLYPDIPAFMLGSGVKDPEFWQLRGVDISAELQRWKGMLENFAGVSVRGPRSRDVLAGLGIRSEVVGDPGLMLGDPAPSKVEPRRVLGVNVGGSADMWGDRPHEVLEHLEHLCRRMIQRGWTIRLIPMWSGDAPHVEEIARSLGAHVEILRDFGHLTTLLGAIRECHALVGVKLHSVVFSAAVFVPAMMLEYQPKCRDFQESIGRGEFLMRTDQIDPDLLVDKVDDLIERREEHQADLHAAVSARRSTLRKSAKEVRRRLSAVMGMDGSH